MASESEQVKADYLADLFGISVRQVQLCASEGAIPKAGSHGYPLAECVKSYVAHIKEESNIVNAEDLADFLGLSTAMIYKMTKQGMPRLKRGKYDRAVCTRWYLDQFRDRLEGGESGDILEERRQLIIQQRRKATIEADVAEGKQISMDAVGAILLEIAGIVVSQLDAMPGRVASEVTGKKTPGEARQVILRECRRIRDSIAGKVERFAGEVAEAAGEDDEGAAEQDAGSVGK